MEDPFAAHSNIDRRERGEPDFTGEQMPLSTKHATPIQDFIDALEGIKEKKVVFVDSDSTPVPYITNVIYDVSAVIPLLPCERGSLITPGCKLNKTWVILKLKGMQREGHTHVSIICLATSKLYIVDKVTFAGFIVIKDPIIGKLP